MLSAIIVDDELNNVRNLEALIAAHCPIIEILASSTSPAEVRELIMSQKPDVIFLDIQMPAMNGFDLLKSLGGEYPFEIVFVTAYNDYGIQALKFSALDYLLKPINIEELKEAVKKVEKMVSLKKQNLRLENLLFLLDKQRSDQNEKIALPTLKETFLVAVGDIIRCQSSNNYTTFFLKDGESRLISKPIHEYEKLLSSYGFIRCHQSHLVNKRLVKSILNEDSGYFIMEQTSEKIPISKQRKSEVKAHFK